MCIRESRFEATSRVVLSTWGPRVWRCTLIIWTPGWSEYGVTDGRRKVHALDAHRIQGFYGVSNESRDKEDLYVSANYRYVRRGLRASRDGITDGENGTLVPGANSAGTTTPGAIAPGR